jgi:hypothetical protein
MRVIWADQSKLHLCAAKIDTHDPFIHILTPFGYDILVSGKQSLKPRRMRQCRKFLGSLASLSRCTMSMGGINVPTFMLGTVPIERVSTINYPELLAGSMPRRQQHLILAWAELHQVELLDNWRRVTEEQPLLYNAGL